jgi:DNA-binding GntR family transcriptional regulator
MDEIRQIVDAIKERNGEAAWKASIDHNRKAAAAALSVLRTPEPEAQQTRRRN